MPWAKEILCHNLTQLGHPFALIFKFLYSDRALHPFLKPQSCLWKLASFSEDWTQPLCAGPPLSPR